MLPNWLNANAPGYENLNPEEREAITNFSLLWSLFEAQVLNTSASSKSIEAKIKSWSDGGHLKAVEFDGYKNYFINRYITSGELNNKFDHLHLRKGDNPDLIISVLKGTENDVSSVVSAMLIIVLRYRNNFFHGIKWAYQFKDQLNNFNTANNLLMRVIEINNHV